jgi:hypothetical protein
VAAERGTSAGAGRQIRRLSHWIIRKKANGVNEPPTLHWSVEEVMAAHPNLYLDHCVVMAVALMIRRTVPPYEFAVEREGFCPLP